VVIIASGSLAPASIGNTGSKSLIGTNASITLGDGSNSGQLNGTGNNETTDKVFSIGGSTGGATICASTANQTLTISQSQLGGFPTPSHEPITWNDQVKY